MTPLLKQWKQCENADLRGTKQDISFDESLSKM